MSWSLGETRALALKAARGAGLAWGMAEEAGAAVVWLQASGLPGAAALAALLDDWEWEGARTCPLSLGAAISDGAPAGRDVGELRQPLLLAPFLWRSAPVRLSWGRAVVEIGAGGAKSASARDELLSGGVPCALDRGRDEPTLEAPATRTPETEAPAIAALRRLASRLLAPATDASRITGAGAGLKDTD